MLYIIRDSYFNSKYSPTPLLEASWQVLTLGIALNTHDGGFFEQVTAGEIPFAWGSRS